MYDDFRPCIAQGHRVHLNAQRTHIIDLVPDGRMELAPRSVSALNGDAGKVLGLCNGELSVPGIIENLRFSVDSKEGQHIERFIQDSLKKGHLAPFKYPEYDPIVQVTGRLDKYIPAHISVEVTGQCNLKCNYRYHGDLESKFAGAHGLDAETLISILEQWRRLGLHSVELTGGEPTLYSGIEQLLEYAVSTYCLTAFLTNGARLLPSIEKTLSSTVNRVIVGISLDASNPDLFAKMTGSSRELFGVTLRNIERYCQMGVQTNVAMAVTSDNVNDVFALAKQMKDIGVKGFAPAIAVPVGFGQSAGADFNLTHLQVFQDQITSITDNYPRFLTNTEEIINTSATDSTGELNRKCDIAKRMAVLSPDGKIRPCLMMDSEWNCGSAVEDGVESVLLSDAFQAAARVEFPPTTSCEDCLYRTHCASCVCTPLSVAEREGKRCAWWAESGMLEWLSKHTESGGKGFVPAAEEVACFTEKRPNLECRQCPK